MESNRVAEFVDAGACQGLRTELLPSVLAQIDAPEQDVAELPGLLQPVVVAVHTDHRGATAVWEQWNGHWSRIHSCFTSIGGWFNQGIAGIRPDPAAPGFKRIVIKPAAVGDLTWAKSHFDGIYGRIESNWKTRPGEFQLEVLIPANTTATVYIPAQNAAAITEGGRPASNAPGVKFLKMENTRAVFRVESGHYHFVSKS